MVNLVPISKIKICEFKLTSFKRLAYTPADLIYAESSQKWSSIIC